MSEIDELRADMRRQLDLLTKYVNRVEHAMGHLMFIKGEGANTEDVAILRGIIISAADELLGLRDEALGSLRLEGSLGEYICVRCGVRQELNICESEF